MSSSSMNNNNNNKNSNNNNNKGLYNNDDTRTCFTDSYEPIIWYIDSLLFVVFQIKVILRILKSPGIKKGATLSLLYTSIIVMLIIIIWLAIAKWYHRWSQGGYCWCIDVVKIDVVVVLVSYI